MFDYIDKDFNEKDKLREKIKKEIPGFADADFFNYDWEMRFRVFDLTDEKDVKEVEQIYTNACKKNKKSGVAIFYENGRFFDDGSFKMLVRWGIWNAKEEKI